MKLASVGAKMVESVMMEFITERCVETNCAIASSFDVSRER